MPQLKIVITKASDCKETAKKSFVTPLWAITDTAILQIRLKMKALNQSNL
jgi:hypothetical protein